ncbi:MAG: hypothetical protein A3H93_05790 [Rhodocyclales bacterium RIFCSPLOWO2_02_FULL_63_24]|nr:MAG: hypothetical protein A3H93_05790 [Rhodocyclales bacterium RIFCSPLOWO2_02_FULL_63_24]
MSPFARYLLVLRKSRDLRQRDLAHLLGYEQSYLSALERSEKGPPRKDFIQRLISGLKLNEDEQAGLVEALNASRRQISLPAKASEREYQLLRALEPKLGQLHPLQIQLIELVLKLPGTFCSEEGQMWVEPGCRQSTRMEAPKM